MIYRLKTPALLLGLAVLVLGAPASAQSIKVPGDFATIQLAVDSASSGDTILVSSGTYTENVVIGNTLDGLTIQGKGKVMIDGFLGNSCFRVHANNVTLKNLILRHSGEPGVAAYAFFEPEGVPLQLAGLELNKLTILNANGPGLFLFVDGVEITNCKIMGCDGGIQAFGVGASINRTEVHHDSLGGIEVNGAGAQVSRCTVEEIVSGRGIEINGDQATIDRNSVSGTQDELILVIGSNATVSRNTLHRGGDKGVSIIGDDAVVDGNIISSTCAGSININGNNAMVTSNKISECAFVGIFLDGINPTVSKNTVTWVGQNGSGIQVVSRSAGGTVESNRVSKAANYGYSLLLDKAMIRFNQADECGSGLVGFLVQGADNTISNNKAMDCAGSGFLITGDRNEVTKNQAKRNSLNGIYIEGSSVSTQLTSNICSDNQAQGLMNEGTGTLLEKNRLSNNRQDLTNRTSGGASYVDNGGNRFKTGGFTVEPDILQ